MAEREKNREGLFVLIHDGKMDPGEVVKSLSPYFGGVLVKGGYPLFEKKHVLVIQAYQLQRQSAQTNRYLLNLGSI